MINNIDLLLIVNYIERANEPRLPIDEREFLRLQFEQAIESQNISDRQFDLIAVLRDYARLWGQDDQIVQALEIPVPAHRWFWKRMTDRNTNFPIQRHMDREQLLQAYFRLGDPFVRYDIIRYFVPRGSGIIYEILRQMSVVQGGVRQSLLGELQELLDILFDLQVASNEPTEILQIILEWITTETDGIRDPLRAFMRLRTDYLVGTVGEQIRIILGLDVDS